MTKKHKKKLFYTFDETYYIIIPALTDDDDVTRQTRSLYVRANKIIRKIIMRRWLQNLRCLKYIMRQFMAVSFGVGCFSTQIEKCTLRTMTPSDNGCVDQDNVVSEWVSRV